ncbi:MAG: hypothetical protein NVS2B4_03130 [Ramlibacter sp.]
MGRGRRGRKEPTMNAAVIRFEIRANPGADMSQIVQSAKEAAKLWKEHGASEVHFYSIMIGEAGCFSFVARFDSAAKLGKTVESLNTDPQMQAWRARNMKAGNTTMVRSNQLLEVSLA